MNHTIGLVGLLCLAFVLAGCVSNNGGARSGGFDITKIAVGPDGAVSWADAKAIIQHGDVDTVMQTHSGAVRIRMQDNTAYSTTQPRVDDVIHWITEVGKRDQIAIMTQ